MLKVRTENIKSTELLIDTFTHLAFRTRFLQSYSEALSLGLQPKNRPFALTYGLGFVTTVSNDHSEI